MSQSRLREFIEAKVQYGILARETKTCRFSSVIETTLSVAKAVELDTKSEFLIGAVTMGPQSLCQSPIISRTTSAGKTAVMSEPNEVRMLKSIYSLLPRKPTFRRPTTREFKQKYQRLYMWQNSINVRSCVEVKHFPDNGAVEPFWSGSLSQSR